MSFFAAGPNDIWSLGVILVNLTCGRNPWKRACMGDSSYRAYLRNPYFLKSILPLTDEMVYILSRMFESDPAKRITIPELRKLVLECPRFTTTSMTPWANDNDVGYVPETAVVSPHTTAEEEQQEVELLHAQFSSASAHSSSPSSSLSSSYSTFSNSGVSDGSSFVEDYPDLAIPPPQPPPSDPSVGYLPCNNNNIKDKAYSFPPMHAGFGGALESLSVLANPMYGSLFPVAPLA